MTFEKVTPGTAEVQWLIVDVARAPLQDYARATVSLTDQFKAA